MKNAAAAFLLLFLVHALEPLDIRAQASDHDAVMATIEGFFEGFAEQDSTKMHRYMDPDGRLVTTGSDQAGRPVMRAFRAGDFLQMLLGPRQQPIRETIANPEIRVVDNLAAVWVDFNLWVGDEIDHCGVDHFQLFRSPEGWRIVATADTNRRTGCVPFE
jgi:hypothetical protein